MAYLDEKLSTITSVTKKVIAGFLLVFVAIVLALGIAHFGFSEMMETVDKLSEPNKKLDALNTIFQEITFTAHEAIYQFAYWRNISLQHNQLFSELVYFSERFGIAHANYLFFHGFYLLAEFLHDEIVVIDYHVQHGV